MDNSNLLSPHFTIGELIHSGRSFELGIDNTPPDGIIERLKIVCCRILEPVRDHYGIPFSPTSGYRCPELNAVVGGSVKSQHMLGQAVDFKVPGVANYDLAQWISMNLIYDQLILENHAPGAPGSGWVHCSIVGGGKNRMECLTINGGHKRNGLCR